MTTLRFDLRRKLTLSDLAESGHQFFAWWRGCLWDFLPEGTRRHLMSAFGHWTVFCDDDALRLKSRNEDLETLWLDPALPDDELRERIARCAPAARDRRVDVLISPSEVLTRRLRLPAAAELRLHSVIELKFARLFPFRSEDVRFDCRRVEVVENGEIVAEVVMVPMRTLDVLERRLASLGLAVGSFRLESLPYRLMPVRRWRTPGERVRAIFGLIAVATLSLALVLTPLMRARELDGLSAEAARLRGPAQRASVLAEDARRTQAPMIAAAADLARPGVLDTLRRLTELLPADAQLTDLKIDGTSVRMTGYCRDTQALVFLLRRSGEFRGIAAAPSLDRTKNGRAEFEINMTPTEIASR